MGKYVVRFSKITLYASVGLKYSFCLNLKNDRSEVFALASLGFKERQHDTQGSSYLGFFLITILGSEGLKTDISDAN